MSSAAFDLLHPEVQKAVCRFAIRPAKAGMSYQPPAQQ